MPDVQHARDAEDKQHRHKAFEPCRGVHRVHRSCEAESSVKVGVRRSDLVVCRAQQGVHALILSERVACLCASVLLGGVHFLTTFVEVLRYWSMSNDSG